MLPIELDVEPFSKMTATALPAELKRVFLKV